MDDSQTPVNFGTSAPAHQRNKRRKFFCRPISVSIVAGRKDRPSLSGRFTNLPTHFSDLRCYRATLPDNRIRMLGRSTGLSDSSPCPRRRFTRLLSHRTKLLDDFTGMWNDPSPLPNSCKYLKTNTLVEIDRQGCFYRPAHRPMEQCREPVGGGVKFRETQNHPTPI